MPPVRGAPPGVGGNMANLRDRVLAVSIGLMIVAAPLLYQRYRLTTQKRLRPAPPGGLHRGGQMPADGFERAIRELGIRTVINVQNEIPDPDLRRSFLDGRTESEQDLCRRLGVRR